MQPLLDLDFRTTFVDGGVLYTPSRGSLVKRAVMGTGVAGNASAPAITPIGASFDGADYVAPGAMPLDWNVPFSLVARCRIPVEIGVTARHMFSNMTNGSTYPHMYWSFSETQMVVVLARTASETASASILRGFPGIGTFVLAYEGTGAVGAIKLYYNGAQMTLTGSGTGITGGTVNVAQGYRIGTRLDNGNAVPAGTSLRRFQAMPFCATAAQARVIHERFEREGES